MAETPPEIIDSGIGLGNKAYASFRGCNVTRITFPDVVAANGKWLRRRSLKFRQNLFGDEHRVLDRGLPLGNPQYVSSVDPLGPDVQPETRRGCGRKLPQGEGSKLP